MRMNIADERDTTVDVRCTSTMGSPTKARSSPSRSRRNSLYLARQSSIKSRKSSSARSQGQMSPPLTPKASDEALRRLTESRPIFHNYLRAFYHFHPESTITSTTDESSITVPLNEGDIILVHSIHANGWADGTLVASGARGWLPTNYCEAYDHPSIRTLLNSLTDLWDLVRVGENGDLTPFMKQDYVRRMIAGVRYLLEQSQCLNRESQLIQAHPGLRRTRKGMLGDLSSLVKSAKKLQGILRDESMPENLFELLDEIITKALKLVTRATRFLDIWSQDVVSAPASTVFDTIDRPLTPPVEQYRAEMAASSTTRSSPNRRTLTLSDPTTVSPSKSSTGAIEQEDTISILSAGGRPLRSASISHRSPSRSSLEQGARSSTQNLSVAHRLSYRENALAIHNQNLASEQLRVAHDSFLGFIGSFIGSHLQSRSSSELLFTTQQSVTACRQLLVVVEEIWERDSRRSEPLSAARSTMYEKIADLVAATRDLFESLESSTDEAVFSPDQGRWLMTAATSCVRSAGDCVIKARYVIERIGDFEFEYGDLASADSVFDRKNEETGKSKDLTKQQTRDSHNFEEPLPSPTPTHLPPPPPLGLAVKRHLPDPPLSSPIKIDRPFKDDRPDSPIRMSIQFSLPSVPSLSQLQIPNFPLPDSGPIDSPQAEANTVPRLIGSVTTTESINTSLAESNSTYPCSVHGDNASVLSRGSTRATTPEMSPCVKQPDHAALSSFGSASELQSMTSEDCVALEAQMMEKTYVGELVYNKEGQIAGGSLPALVEQMTTPESTPDATFVTAFYLTFRLFATPVELAQCLIDRFEYVGDSPVIGIPVRLRVYNVFKGWLESHWNPESDSAALAEIFSFANGKLRNSMPAAGKRLTELAAKMTETSACALGTRLVSSFGKTSTSSTVFTSKEATAPNPNITKSQLNMLRSARVGAGSCTILDFDPLELARQLTIIESKIFCSIRPDELLASEWTKKTDSKAVNVRAMSTLSTDLANLVADTILQLEDAKKRAAIIKQWVKVAKKCLELNNYDSLMAIICSLNSSMVLRLKRTWELVSQKTNARLEELRTIVDVSKNYAVLRQRLQYHTAPCIPFVGIYLTDLTFVDVGNQTTRKVPGGASEEDISVINFDKHMKTAKIISQLQRFQVPYRLNGVPELQEWMESQIQRVRNSDSANVRDYYRRSLLLEPRNPPQTQKFSPTEVSPTAALTSSTKVSPREKVDFLSSFHFPSSSISKDKVISS